MANVSNVKLERVNMNLPVKLVNRVKHYSKANGLPITQAYVVLLNLALKNESMIENFPVLLDTLKNLNSIKKNIE